MASGFTLPQTNYGRYPEPYQGPNDPRIPAHVRAGRTHETTPEHTHRAVTSMSAPRMPWDRFYTLMNWKQGEHVGLIGPTGQGKTTLLISLLTQRTYVCVFGTKPRDETMEKMIASGYMHYDKWQNIPAHKVPKRVIWPDSRSIDSEDEQKEVFKKAYAMAFREGGWTITVDEGWYMGKVLGLEKQMRAVWTQGRSLGVTQVVATQRPAWIPGEMYDQSTHLFFWRNNDARMIQRVSEIGTTNSAAIRVLLPNLDEYECLYLNTRTGKMYRTRAPAP
jgi:hypothetical protein